MSHPTHIEVKNPGPFGGPVSVRASYRTHASWDHTQESTAILEVDANAERKWLQFFIEECGDVSAHRAFFTVYAPQSVEILRTLADALGYTLTPKPLPEGAPQ